MNAWLASTLGQNIPILIIMVRHSIMMVQTVIAVFSYSLNTNLPKEMSLLWEEYPERPHHVL